jgi:hypothetical protein
MSQVRTLFIGFNGEEVVDSVETQRQIDEVKNLECDLEYKGEKLSWDLLDDLSEPRTLFQFVLGDRRIRVDQHTLMADRPPIAVVTTVGNKAVRLEFYEGHDALKLTYDFRASELEGKDIPRWLETDPQAYNPFKFLQSVGFPVPDDMVKAIDEEQKST